ADNTAENLTTAESRIRDVDMAAEMVKYSKDNILQQAAQSMLSQANQSSQGVLSILR
ncbi:MAG TPA: flagellin, partial [Lachnospiraceae bacterium]|nr:flagellin [Lachnospiraceae bacterium]